MDERDPIFSDAANEHNRKLLESKTDLTIMILGKPGIGKSTLINGLLGKKLADVSAVGAIAVPILSDEKRQCHYYDLGHTRASGSNL